jgi:hypothetical protein
MNGGGRGGLNELKAPSAECRKRRLALLREYADRFKDKIAGWWFDGVGRSTYCSAPHDWREIGAMYIRPIPRPSSYSASEATSRAVFAKTWMTSPAAGFLKLLVSRR